MYACMYVCESVCVCVCVFVQDEPMHQSNWLTDGLNYQNTGATRHRGPWEIMRHTFT